MAERKKTRYDGVLTTQSARRKHKGKPDTGFVIDYADADGKRHRKLVGWSSEGMTAAAASEIRRQVLERVRVEKSTSLPEVRRVDKALTLEQAWQRYRKNWLEAHGKAVQNLLYLVNGPLSELMPMRLADISPLDIDKLMASMRKEGFAVQTICHAVALVRRIINRMVAWDLYTGPDIFRKIKLPVPNNRRERFLTPAEAHALLDEVKRRSVQTWAMCLVSLHCGLRFGEVAALRWSDLRPGEKLIYIAESKSGHARHAVMTQEVADALAELPRSSDLIFPSRTGKRMIQVSCSFERAVNALQLNGSADSPVTDRRQRVVFHTLRHSYASWLAMSGERELALAELLGHSSTAMTKRYVHLMDNARRASADKISSLFHSEPPADD